MEKVINLNKYTLETINYYDDYVDYDIFYGEDKIGVLLLRITDEIFIRQIRIDEQFRKMGHATTIIDNLICYFNKTISLCVATNSPTAISFWTGYFKTKNKVTNPKGNVYKIHTT